MSVRLSAFLVLLVEAIAFAYFTGDHLVPAFFALTALLGALRNRRWIAGPKARIAWILFLGLLIAASPLVSPYQRPTPSGIFQYPALAHGVGLYLLAFQALQIFIDPRYPTAPPQWLRQFWGLRGAFPCYGIGVFIAAGDMNIDRREHVYFLAACAFHLAATWLYMGLRTRPVDSAAWDQSRWRRTRFQLTLLVLSLSVGTALSFVVLNYGNLVDRILSNMLINPNLGSTMGFSSSSGLDSIRAIRGNSANAISLRVYGEGPPGYLRALVYDSYDKGRWQRNAPRFELRAPDPGDTRAPKPAPAQTLYSVRPTDAPSLKTHEIWSVMTLADQIFAPMDTAYVSCTGDGLLRDSYYALLPRNSVPAQPYTVYTDNAPANEPPDAIVRNNLLQLSNEVDGEVRDFARGLIGDATGMEAADRVVQYFRQNYTYQFGIQVPPGQKPLNYFLLQRPPAHCEYFATATAILLRIAGIPTRYATGFVCASKHPYGGYWIARNKDAHAWVEAWIDGQGWVTLEATPESGVPQPEVLSRWGLLQDYAQHQAHLLRTTLRSAGLFAMLAEVPRTLKAFLRPALYLTAIVAMLLLLRQFAPVTWRRLRQPPTRATATSHAGLHALLAQQDKALARHGLVRRHNETLHAFAGRLETAALPSASRAAAWYRHYATLRYTGAPYSDALSRLQESLWRESAP
ncbi:MAG: transglutaminase domain-containing protein [Candidatus Hydrogenedentes bacterium]|nr:transglutaminase domain-containing protein [Candidatus Hydrogenedentota bacterium]